MNPTTLVALQLHVEVGYQRKEKMCASAFKRHCGTFPSHSVSRSLFFVLPFLLQQLSLHVTFPFSFQIIIPPFFFFSVGYLVMEDQEISVRSCFNMKRKLFCLEWGVDRKVDKVVVMSEVSGNTTSQGFVSRASAA